MLEKDYNAVLNETYDFFQNSGVNIIGEGYKEIASNPSLFGSYVENLTEGVSADHAAAMSQLMENSNTQILTEGQVAGIAPLASLSMPVIRKLWPKFALKEAVKTEVAKTPRFIVAYTKPYLQKGDGEKVYIPLGLKDASGNAHEYLAGKKIYASTAVGTSGTSAGVTCTIGSVASVTWAHDLSVESGSLAKKQALASILLESVGGASVMAKTDITNSIYTEVELPARAGTTTGWKGQKVAVLIRSDFAKGTAVISVLELAAGASDATATAGATGDAVKAKLTAIDVVVSGKMSQIYNEVSPTLGFDIERIDVAIPTGEHINASLPIEALNDMMALYQIDGTKEAVDLMTNTVSMGLDLEIMKFLKDSYFGQPGVIKDGGYGDYSKFGLVFDVRPAAGFAGGPKEWREELKPQIDFLAQSIKSATYLQQGVFNLVCHPIDAQLISNVDWQFRGGQGSMDGVDVDYSVGTYVGANAYRVIASNNVPQGQMYVVFLPSSEKQMTYKYYPYTFSVEQGYIDPNHSRVPSVMVTKRHAFQEFLPAIGLIVIANNDGTGQFNPYVSTKAYTGSELASASDEAGYTISR